MHLQQQRREQHQKVVQSVVGAHTNAFDNANYDSVPAFLRDWRSFLKSLAPNTPDIVGVLDKCVAGWMLRQACRRLVHHGSCSFSCSCICASSHSFFTSVLPALGR
jgi:hypothetical protein